MIYLPCSSSLITCDGFLKNPQTWHIKIATYIAKKENILLTDDHWKVLIILRNYYLSHTKMLSIRFLVKELQKRYGTKIGSSLYLQILFPVSPAMQAAKIAGLPKPKTCI